MTNKIYNALIMLGFDLVPMEGLYYAFKYENIGMVWFPNDKDPHFLNITIPMIHERGEEDESDYYRLIDALNANMVYVKAYSYQGHIWFGYERELLDDEEDLEQILFRMILRLADSFNNFSKLTSESLKDGDDNVDTEDDMDDEVDFDKLN